MIVDDAIALLSGFHYIVIKRKTSFFEIDIDFWFDPNNIEESTKELITKVSFNILKNSKEKYEYEIRTTKYNRIIMKNELQITAKKNGKIQYGERIKVDTEISMNQYFVSFESI